MEKIINRYKISIILLTFAEQTENKHIILWYKNL
jgi:hypothetical protein